MGQIAKIRTLASELMSRANLASKAGITYSGSRKVFAALGYKEELTIKDYRDRYKRNAIAGRIVEAFPKATWRGGVEIIEDEDPDSLTLFEAAWEELENRLHVISVLMRADILAGLGRYSVVLIGAEGKLDSELPLMSGPEKILYLSPFGEDDATIDKYVTDSDNPRFGLPEQYKFKRLDSSPQQRPRYVHWSRVLHIADGILDEQLFGEPRLKRCWNLLDDLEKVSGGGAEAFWLRAHQGFQLDIPTDVEMEETDMTDLQDEVDEYIHGFRRFMRTRGVNLTALGSTVANFSTPVDAIITLISGGTGIPKRILVGSEMGQLASTQDRTNWQERVNDRQEQFASPQVIGPFIDRLIEYKVFPEPLDYEIRWPITQNLDEDQRSVVADKLAGLNKKAGEIVITGAEIRDRILMLPRLEEVEEEEEIEEEVEEEGEEEEEEEEEGKEKGVIKVEGGPIAARKKGFQHHSLKNLQNKNRGKMFTWLQTGISAGCQKPTKKQLLKGRKQ